MEKPVSAPQRRLSLAVREPVHMDVAYHGVRFITAEFVGMTLLLLGFAALEIGAYIGRSHAAQQLLWAGIFAFVGVNALTFLVLAREGVRQGAVPSRDHFTPWAIFVYTVEAVVLLLLPLLFPLLARLQRRRM